VLIAEHTKPVDDPQIRFEIQPDAGLAAPPSSLESDLFVLISKVAAQEFGGVPVLPFQSTGATDSAQLRLRNVQAYGLEPFPMTDADFSRMHGDDERLPVASFSKGVDLLAKVVAEFAATR
jgi:acetylornithine deacetylase/succinyl-diaminopimelate desuccinylase-like protein